MIYNKIMKNESRWEERAQDGMILANIILKRRY